MAKYNENFSCDQFNSTSTDDFNSFSRPDFGNNIVYKKPSIFGYILFFVTANMLISSFILSFSFYYFGPDKLRIVLDHIFSGDIFTPVDSDLFKAMNDELDNRLTIIHQYRNRVEILENQIVSFQNVIDRINISTSSSNSLGDISEYERFDPEPASKENLKDSFYQDATGVWRNH